MTEKKSETRAEKKTSQIKKVVQKALPVILIAFGILILAFSFISQQMNRAQVSRTMTVYAENNKSADTDYLAAKKTLIEKYNNTLSEADYDRLDEIIGYISIEKLDISYPIYRYETEENLLKGVAHVSGTHIPSAEKGTNAMLLGHNGEYSSELFTHLDRLVVGDEVSISILDEELTYEVCDKKTVLPEDVSCQTDANESLITLVTCTPYGVNTHRLIVTCKLKGEQ